MASQRFSACKSMTIGFGPKKSFKSMIVSVRESRTLPRAVVWLVHGKNRALCIVTVES
jgi:hypothetical protein